MGIRFYGFSCVVSMKLQRNNKVLIKLSQYTLEIYLIQRIPMIIFKNVFSDNLLYFLFCVAITVILAFIWKQLFNAINKLIISEKQEK